MRYFSDMEQTHRSPRPSGPATLAKRARYIGEQGLRTLWYGSNYAFARRRSAGFTRPGEPAFQPTSGQPDIAVMRSAFFDAFQQDLANIEAGLYPAPREFRPGAISSAVQRALKFQGDVPNVDERRLNRRGTDVREIADPEKYPTYYRQNFHYQSGGWFTEESADIYDTQVEVLFTGSADVMRRCVLGEVARQMKGRRQDQTVFLDLACGTGRFLSQVMDAFPRLKASGLDLSPTYSAKARDTVAAWPHVDIIEAQAEAIPLPDNSADVISNIYLFHELPPKIRPQVLAEVARVLKPGGVFVFADSLQFGDVSALDGLLEYFPEGFHEPYYKSYLSEDFPAMIEPLGLVGGPVKTAFLTRFQTWSKPA